MQQLTDETKQQKFGVACPVCGAPRPYKSAGHEQVKKRAKDAPLVGLGCFRCKVASHFKSVLDSPVEFKNRISSGLSTVPPQQHNTIVTTVQLWEQMRLLVSEPGFEWRRLLKQANLPPVRVQQQIHPEILQAQPSCEALGLGSCGTISVNLLQQLNADLSIEDRLMESMMGALAACPFFLPHNRKVLGLPAGFGQTVLNNCSPLLHFCT